MSGHSPVHFRLARPVRDIHRAQAMYLAGLEWVRLGHFEDHEAFDGVMVGRPGEGFHLEFTYCRPHPVIPTPTADDLLVFYLPDRNAWEARCEAMLRAGFAEVSSTNPYWNRNGRTFQDADGYRIVIECASWTNVQETQGRPAPERVDTGM